MLHTELDNDIKTIRIEYGKANAIDDLLLDNLIAETKDLSVKGLTITGAGDCFSAGLNLPLLVDYDRQQMYNLMHKFHHFQLDLLQAPFPVVAAINGHCIAGGFIMALNCDYRIARTGPFKLGMNEMILGISLPPIATARIEQLHNSQIMKLGRQGQLVDPDQALAAGLIHRLVNESDLYSAASNYINNFNQNIKLHANSELIKFLSIDFESKYKPFLDIWFSDQARRHINRLIARLNRSNA
ncbi:MAG: enoyl-CoA hydratase/isomerase family protein [Candidatus Marinimicrobia bacterium]|nr:enoyl-CoA hydratase/isomerase family protein [Candidatus Neomarinimicrobiota bacterium]